MKKFVTLFFVSVFYLSAIAQQVQSPEQFLGYKLGEHFTPHYKIVNYFNYLATQFPEVMKLEKYGETNEGRSLLLATISSKENISNLENIRLNNLRLANAASDKVAAVETTPAIVWLSYNVHGNEPSSSEAAMLTIFQLLNPANAQSKQWLKNMVVMIDPCINPDGRDRYVNWYNQTVGKIANANPDAREHKEPWPRGRANHYYFDLNRDWAWQTQVETQQRMALYNKWLPQVHVDFHEQGYNEPYYFAPAAEPFHEVITPWQRNFQTQIGKNNAKYFDQNGWLYFTKERFDLFYPSYGDTYPTYSGAIGMTFEQGGISAGLAVQIEDGDTLTLADRLLHHYTTGMSTIEISSINADKLVKEFHTYFNNTLSSPLGDYKSYIIKNDGTDRIERLKTLLDRNSIAWGYVSGSNLNGLNYLTAKAESFKTEAGDIAVNANQSKGNLVKVLFERSSKLSDSATYDITAWSIPFAYGLKTYAVKDVIGNTSKTNPAAANTNKAVNGAYAYVVKWDGLNSARFLSELLQKGIKVRYAEQGFNVAGQDFQKGSLIITKAANNATTGNAELLQQAAAKAGVVLYPVATGFVDKGFDVGSDKVRVIKSPKVALLAGESVSSLAMGEIWHFFEQQLQYPIALINVNTISEETLKEVNTLILPDGNYSFLSNKEASEQLKNWVRGGGKIIAIESAVTKMAKADWGLKLKGDDDKKDDGKKDDYQLLRKYENRERDNLVNSMPGAIYKVELDNSHPLAFGYPDYYYTLKQDENIYEFLKDGWNVGVIKKDNYVAGFAGSKSKEKLKDGLLFGVQEMGSGQVVYFTDNPLFRSFWENGKLLFCNAVFMVGQ